MAPKLKHILLYEAIVDWRGAGLEEFQAAADTAGFPMDRAQYVELAERHGIRVVDYRTFYDELPDRYKKGAPPAGTPAFAMVDPNTFRPKVVLSVQRVDRRLFDFIFHMLKHENVHVGQYSRRQIHPKGAWDVSDRGRYFSHKDEVMAFAQSVADQLISMGARSKSDILRLLPRSQLWVDIRSTVSSTVRKRYLKYIYLYFENEVENK